MIVHIPESHKRFNEIQHLLNELAEGEGSTIQKLNNKVMNQDAYVILNNYVVTNERN